MTAFITTTDLSNYIGRDVTSDAGGTLAVNAACEIVRTLTEQDFDQVTGGTVRLDGSGTDALLLPQLPVTSISSVTIGGTITSGTVTGGSAVTDWALRDDGVLLRTAGAAVAVTDDVVPSIWPTGRQNIAVIYNHGYGTATIPDDIKMVAISIANRLITQGGAISETVGQVSKRYAVASTDLTNGEMAILRKYKVSR